MRTRALVVFLLLLVAPAEAVLYYVDYTNGCNLATGTTNATCAPCVAHCAGTWKTPPGTYCPGSATLNGAGANNKCTQPDTGGTEWNTIIHGGDTISLLGGRTYPILWWINSNHYDATATTDINIRKVGGGTDPLIEGADLITNLPEVGTTGYTNGWKVEDGPNNIYSFRVCTSTNTPCTYDRTFYGCFAGGSASGEQLQVLRSKAGVDGGQYDRMGFGGDALSGYSTGKTCVSTSLTAPWMLAYDCAGNRICVRTDGSDPRSDGSLWKVGWRAYGILISSIPHVNIQNLQFQDSSLILQNQALGGEIAFDNSGVPPSNITVKQVTIFNSGAAGFDFYLSATSSNGLNMVVSNNTVTRSYAYGFTGNNVDATVAQNWSIDHNTFSYNGDHGISLGQFSDWIVDKNIVHHNAVGEQACGQGPCGGKPQSTGGGIFAATRLGAINKNATITRNIAYLNGPLNSAGVTVQTCQTSIEGFDNASGLNNAGIAGGDFTGVLNISNNLSYLNNEGILINPNGGFVDQGIYELLNNTTANNNCAEFVMNQGHPGTAPNGMDVRNNAFIRDSGFFYWPSFSAGAGASTPFSTVIWIPYNQSLTAWTWDYNNVSVPSGAPAVACGTSSSHNCYWFDGSNYQTTPPAGKDTHGVNCAATFINETTGDPSAFGLSATDTCMQDKGTNTGTGANCALTPAACVTDDRVLTARPQGAAYDLGSWEATATTSSTSTSTSVTTSSSTSTSSTSSSSTSTSTSSTSTSTAPPQATMTRII